MAEELTARLSEKGVEVKWVEGWGRRREVKKYLTYSHIRI
jgi:hypothetical protein